MGPRLTALRDSLRAPSCKNACRAERCLRTNPSGRSCCGELDLEEFEFALTTRRGAGSRDSRMPSLRTKGRVQCSVLTRIRLPSTGEGVLLGLEISGVERAVSSRPREFHKRTVLGLVASVMAGLTGLRPSSSTSSSSRRLWRRRRQKQRRMPISTRAPMAPARPPTMACLREFGMEIRSEEADSVACDPMFVGVVRLELVDVLE
jgi:hypothetical protein